MTNWYQVLLKLPDFGMIKCEVIYFIDTSSNYVNKNKTWSLSFYHFVTRNYVDVFFVMVSLNIIVAISYKWLGIHFGCLTADGAVIAGVSMK